MPQSRGFAYWNALAEHELPEFGSADHGYFFRATWKALRQARALGAAGDAAGARKVLNDRVWAIEQRELPKLAGQAGEETARVRAYLTEAAALYHAGRLPGSRADAGGAPSVADPLPSSRPPSLWLRYFNSIDRAADPGFGDDGNAIFRDIQRAQDQAAQCEANGDPHAAYAVMRKCMEQMRNSDFSKLSKRETGAPALLGEYLREVNLLWQSGHLPGADPLVRQRVLATLPVERKSSVPQYSVLFPVETEEQRWKDRALALYGELNRYFMPTTEAHASRFHGEILRDLQGNPIVVHSGGNRAMIFYLTGALRGWKPTPPPPKTAPRPRTPEDLYSGLDTVHPELVPKVEQLLRAVNARLPSGWELHVYETSRTPERQLKLFKRGVTKIATARGKHCQTPAEAVDVVFKHQGQWTWESPYWTIVDDEAAKLAGIRRINWDKPHVELLTR